MATPLSSTVAREECFSLVKREPKEGSDAIPPIASHCAEGASGSISHRWLVADSK